MFQSKSRNSLGINNKFLCKSLCVFSKMPKGAKKNDDAYLDSELAKLRNIGTGETLFRIAVAIAVAMR